jgi:O-antigen/teichoic acid export membrane protein
MRKKWLSSNFISILGTLLTRVGGAAISLITLILTARWFGPEGRGEISYLMTLLTLLNLAAGFTGISALTYLSPRYSTLQLWVWVLLGIVIIVPIVSIGLVFGGWISPELGVLIGVCAFFISLHQCHQGMLLGKGRLEIQNISSIIAGIGTLVGIMVLANTFIESPGKIYLWAATLAVLPALLFTGIYLKPFFKEVATESWSATRNVLWGKGSSAQLSNLIHFFNYRLAFFWIESTEGKSVLGVYAVAIALSESVWLISQSLAAFQIMKVSRAGKDDNVIANTWKLAFLSLILATIASAVLVGIPSALFTQIFHTGFEASKTILPWMIPGVLAQSFSTLLAHYFAGKGKYRVNLYSSICGIGITILGLGISLPYWGIYGAAATASACYVSMLIFQLVAFLTRKS